MSVYLAGLHCWYTSSSGALAVDCSTAAAQGTGDCDDVVSPGAQHTL